MALSLSDLPPKVREQAIAKLAVAEVKRRNKQNKYHAKKTDGVLADGTPHKFDSIKERDRYNTLALSEESGQISDLQIQVKYPLVPSQKLSNGKTLRGIDYIADFVYKKGGVTVVEDVKGYRDGGAYRVFMMKKKLMKFIHDIEVMEV